MCDVLGVMASCAAVGDDVRMVAIVCSGWIPAWLGPLSCVDVTHGETRATVERGSSVLAVLVFSKSELIDGAEIRPLRAASGGGKL